VCSFILLQQTQAALPASRVPSLVAKVVVPMNPREAGVFLLVDSQVAGAGSVASAGNNPSWWRYGKVDYLEVRSELFNFALSAIYKDNILFQ